MHQVMRQVISPQLTTQIYETQADVTTNKILICIKFICIKPQNRETFFKTMPAINLILERQIYIPCQTHIKSEARNRKVHIISFR